MKSLFLLLLAFMAIQIGNAQVSTVYDISFDNAVHHEAEIHATFKNL